MYCHCTVCGSTFNGAIIPSKYDIPCKCSDCGKKVSAPHVPAVRAATDEEILAYKRFKKSEVDRAFRDLHGGKPLGA